MSHLKSSTKLRFKTPEPVGAPPNVDKSKSIASASAIASAPIKPEKYIGCVEGFWHCATVFRRTLSSARFSKERGFGICASAVRWSIKYLYGYQRIDLR